MTITVQVAESLARTLRTSNARGADAEARALLGVAHELGVALVPLHGGTDDARLARYFTVDVPDVARAEDIARRLRQVAGVEAAYVKPPDELP
jgi:hypothetical protein